MYDLFETPALTDEAQQFEALTSTLDLEKYPEYLSPAGSGGAAIDTALAAIAGVIELIGKLTSAGKEGEAADLEQQAGVEDMMSEQGKDASADSTKFANTFESILPTAKDFLEGTLAGSGQNEESDSRVAAFAAELAEQLSALNKMMESYAAKGASEEQLAALAQSTLTVKTSYFGGSIGATFGDSLGDAIGDAISDAIGPGADPIGDAIGEIGDAIADALGVTDQTSEEAESKESEAAKPSKSEPEQLDLSQVFKADSFAFTFAA